MSKILEEYLSLIPEELRVNLTISGDFCGNRTLAKFKFLCGCETQQSLKAILKLKRFDYCFKHTKQYAVKFTCEYCQTAFVREDYYQQCLSKCKNIYSLQIKNIDYVVCKICGFHNKRITDHIRKIHNLSKKEYLRQYPNSLVICENSHNNYVNSIIENGNWIQKAKENGDDLTQYWEKVSVNVRNAILSSPDEIKRRSILMGKINQTDLMRQKASQAAKITSARPEILKARSNQLDNWRKKHPEDFKKCTAAMLNSWQSKPEKKLFEFISSIPYFLFKKNQRIKSEDFLSITKEKQIDMADKSKRIYIEFDGIFHFKNIFNSFSLNRKKDLLLDNHIKKHNWTLIRVSYDQFVYKTNMINKVKQDNSYFKQECLDKIKEILNDKIPGIYKIGEAYGQY